MKDESMSYLDALKEIKRLKEVLKNIQKEIDDSILICQENAQINDWCDGELAGFLQSKDIINRNLSEVELDEG